ncbi:MAG: hypothetical protein HDR51_02915 [Treponema sp.]|nr:hypothetical protein [Treponema sp.]
MKLIMIDKDAEKTLTVNCREINGRRAKDLLTCQPPIILAALKKEGE